MSRKQFNCILILFLVVVSFIPSLCQDTYLTLAGQVLDGKTKAPLAYATISIKGKNIGTLSNTQGEFSFNFPAAHRNDTLFISYLGYTTYSTKVAALDLRKAHTIQLMPQVITLAEIKVVNKELTPKQIVQAATRNIASNYPTDPFIMDGFYREWSIRHRMDKNQKVPSLFEAAVSIVDEGYDQKRSAKHAEKVYIQELRKSALAEDTWNKLSRLLHQNFVKYTSSLGNDDALPAVLQFPNSLEYTLLKTEVENGEYFYVIALTLPDSPARYELYISYDDYAIARIDLKGEATPKQPVSVSRRFSSWQLTRVDNTVRFRRFNHKLYPSYLRSHWETRLVDAKTGQAMEKNTFYSELLVNTVKTDGVADEAKKLTPFLMKPNTPLSALQRPYNAGFWKHYNIIQEVPLDKQIEKMLGEAGELEKQFMINPQTRKNN